MSTAAHILVWSAYEIVVCFAIWLTAPAFAWCVNALPWPLTHVATYCGVMWAFGLAVVMPAINLVAGERFTLLEYIGLWLMVPYTFPAAWFKMIRECIWGEQHRRAVMGDDGDWKTYDGGDKQKSD